MEASDSRSPGERISGTPGQSERTFRAHRFEELYRSFVVGEFTRENEAGAETTIRAYELILDPMNQDERSGMLAEFGLRAAAAGYRSAVGPITVSGVGYKDAEGRRPLTAVYVFLESSGSSRSEAAGS